MTSQAMTLLASRRINPDVAKNSLPDRVRHVRRQARLTQATLAERLGVGPSAVAQWESPRGTSPTVENLRKLAVACEVAFEWLATGRGEVRLAPLDVPAVQTISFAADYIEERLLLAFRRVTPHKREAFVRWMEELF